MSQEQLRPESVPRADEMPMLGLGTWQNEDPEQCVESVRTALEMGYRHIDTAQAYGNEESVGEGIEGADVPRKDVFLATKVWTENLSYDDVIHSTTESLDELDVESVDLLYAHWPADEYDAEDTLPAFAELKDRGAIDRIGVSNFEPEHLDTASEVLDEPIFANQVECHPLLPQDELRSYCDDHDIELVAYSPLARGEVFEVDELTDIAEKHDASAAQISLAWLREKGVTTIPKATGKDHIEDNWNSLAVDLDDEDIATIDGIDRKERQVDPDFAPW
ncbi:aldo/keto reductase [Halococcus saccharolyticus]|uniref:Aldo/keto reductase n=1 Tax=Halococcus saccharolyticus DSM 5350 TaxID=1227455 RepID=M0MIA9_9EURY|nr:aldo/keto reductase [Halococcus saccharolyticus]EMA45447.1 aldo/keto reductase [Halococcus saccharolyticus DSM 5350]